MSSEGIEPIAIVGLACRVPGAGDARQLWRNLVAGVESIRWSTREEQIALGVPEDQVDDPAYVPAAPALDDVEYFDADFFGMTTREAEIADPQQRLFLELAHTALEDAGHDPGRFGGEIGVYGGTGADEYQWLYLRRNRKLMALSGILSLSIGNNPDYLATTVSYKLDLRGPSFTLHTACSTSLVAIHLACEGLRSGDCEMALAGGVCIEVPHGKGYMYEEGGITSPDGHCRPFDARAAGTLWGSGGGVVVLRRLEDAIADGDHVRAVILGNAINNDGASKVGFSAPSVEGQAEVVAHAVGIAGVEPRSISYVEAHGTGTAIGDPIELAALTTVYAEGTDERGWCGIGSIKSNIGHLSQGAGVAGLIKTVLALENRLVPPTLHYETPNPAIDFASSPFYVNAALSTWEADGGPRRAAVSSFGIGGTNAHIVLEEAPEPGATTASRPAHVLQLCARTETALAASRSRLAAHLREHPDLDLADVAHTLRAGRAEHAHRAVVVARDVRDAAAALADRKRVRKGVSSDPAPGVAFLFSGQGSQYAGMGAGLYDAEPVFRQAVDECAGVLAGALGEDLRPLLFAKGEARAAADDRLQRTELTQPALFTIEYALAALWRSWGVEPAAMIGHSIGEYVAATLAGVFPLPNALKLVALRGQLMQALPAGAMLAVPLEEAMVRDRLPEGLSVAVVNGPGSCVVAGRTELVEAFAEQLGGEDVSCRRLRTSHAFHSPMMEPVLAAFRAAVERAELRSPRLRFFSNLTGDWITDEQAVDPGYWARHLRETVRFGDCVGRLHASGAHVLVECGPGRQLAGQARQQHPAGSPLPPQHSLPGATERQGDLETVLAAAGALWTAGVPLEPAAMAGGGRRVPLPTYPYERRYHWVTADLPAAVARPERRGPLPLDDWFAVPAWRQAPPDLEIAPLGRVLVFSAAGAADQLTRAGADTIEVLPGERYERESPARYRLRPASPDDYRSLLTDLGEMPSRIVHAWALGGTPAGGDADAAWRAQDDGFFSLLHLAQALAAAELTEPVAIDILTCGTLQVTGCDLTRPEHATAGGIVRVVPLELSGLAIRQVDLDAADGGSVASAARELLRVRREETVALRGGRRWALGHEPVRVPAAADPAAALREGGVYILTGGQGGIGITLAEDMARRTRVCLVLLARSALPPRDGWDERLRVHGAGDRVGRAIAAIRRIEAAGSEVVTLAADVTSPADMRRVRDQVLARCGRVDGIVHAAGVAGGGMAEVKARPAAEAVMAPKVRGTLALREAFGDLAMDFVALCSSVTAIAGGFGQVDYCAANSFMDAHAASDHGWRAHVVSIDWGGWLDVGMAAETAVPDALRALEGRERTSPIEHPVLTTLHEPDEGPAWCSGVVSASTHWLLDEHRIGGVPVVPGTGHLEVVRRAAEEVLPGSGAVELRDVVFVEPMAVPDGAAAELRVTFTEAGDFRVTSLSAGLARLHVTGSAALVDPMPAPVGPPPALSRPGPDGPASEASLAPALLTFGPRWDCLVGVHVGDDEEIALLESTDDVSRWGLHPALLDVATAFGRSRRRGQYLPFGYGRVLVRAPLPARFWSRLRSREATDELVSADLSLVDAGGRELVAISDFVLRRVDPHAVTATLAGASEAAPAAVPAEQRAGIRPADGAEAFHRLLAAGLAPQVVVTPAPLDRVIEGARRLTMDVVEEETAAVERPQRTAGSTYAAPRTELEATLAGLWTDVLSVEGIGAEDDFFELGGNSLVAVQLISLVRKAVGVKLPMRTLFDAPTVAGMAARVEQLKAAGAPVDADAATTIKRLPRSEPAGATGRPGDAQP
jgi:acyl transferase domain-containing protein/acyl carrier protein